MNLITEATLAKQLHVSRKAVYRQRMAGNIPFIKFGGSVRFQADIVQKLFPGSRSVQSSQLNRPLVGAARDSIIKGNMNIFYKFWDILKPQQKTKPGRKEGIVVAGVYVKPRGLARTLQQDRVDRAVRNMHRPHFGNKFLHPRRYRCMGANLKP